MTQEEIRLKNSAAYYSPADSLDRAVISLDAWWVEKYVKGPAVLEMGCSDGTSSQLLSERSERLDIIDGSEAYCQLVREKLPAKNVHVHHVLYENFAPQNLFNDIVFARSLDYVTDPVQ